MEQEKPYQGGLGYLDQAKPRTNNIKTLAVNSSNVAEDASNALYSGITQSIPNAIKQTPRAISNTVLGGIDSIRDFANQSNGMRPSTERANTSDDLGGFINSAINMGKRAGEDIAYSTNAAGQFLGNAAYDALNPVSNGQPDAQATTPKFSKEQARELILKGGLKPNKKPVHQANPQQQNYAGGMMQPSPAPRQDIGIENLINLIANNQPERYQAPESQVDYQQFAPNRANYQPERSILNRETGINANSMADGAFGGMAGMNTALAALLPFLEERGLNRKANDDYLAAEGVAEERYQSALKNERGLNNDAASQNNKENVYDLGLAKMLGDLMQPSRNGRGGVARNNYMPVTLTDTDDAGAKSQRIVPFNKATGKATEQNPNKREQAVKLYKQHRISFADNPDKLKQLDERAKQLGLI